MRFRCSRCHAPTEMALPSGDAPVLVACSACGRRHRISVRRPALQPDADRYRKAREFADANGIDLGAAYSVLEGIMRLEDAQALTRPGSGRAGTGRPGTGRVTGSTTPLRSLQRDHAVTAAVDTPAGTGASAARPSTAPASASTGAAAAPAAPVSGVPGGGTEVDYDPAFAAAVGDGRLTTRQAAERGDRQALAARLAHRHRLTTDLALLVADNRITVHEALQRKRNREERDVPRSQTSISHGVWNFIIASMGTLILFGLLVRVYNEWDMYLTARAEAGERPRIVLPAAAVKAAGTAASRPSPPPVPPLTVTRTDAVGQLIEVTGPDPRSVLLGFCNAGRAAGHRRPFGIAPSVPPGGGIRMGLFINQDQPDAPVRAVRIHRDPRSGRWSVGDGRTPIVTENAPSLPDGAKILPVDSRLPDDGGGAETDAGAPAPAGEPTSSAAPPSDP